MSTLHKKTLSNRTPLERANELTRVIKYEKHARNDRVAGRILHSQIGHDDRMSGVA